MRRTVQVLTLCGIGALIAGGQPTPGMGATAPPGHYSSVAAIRAVRSPAMAAATSATTRGTRADRLAAERGMGSLAFRRDDGLYVLDGADGALHRVTTSKMVASLAWSPDGQWLAYIARDPAHGDPGPLWLVRADGSQRHQVTGLPAGVAFATWSPMNDTLVVSFDSSAHPASGYWLVAPSGQPHPLAVEGPLTGLTSMSAPVWSPDGKLLAFTASAPASQSGASSDTLYVVASSGGRAIRLVSSAGNGIELAGWWSRGGGLLYWVDPMHSASLAADGMQLFTLPIGGKPELLTRSLAATYHITLGYPDWLRWSSDGRSLLLVAGAGRPVWDGKQIAACDAFGAACQLLPRPAQGTVTLDPALSPDGTRLAYVQAKAVHSFGFSSAGAFNAWIATRTLWLAYPDGSGAHQLTAAGAGIYWPHWAPDGQHLLYVRDHAVWLIDSRGGAPVRLTSIVRTDDDMFGYYGHVDWSSILAYTPR